MIENMYERLKSGEEIHVKTLPAEGMEICEFTIQPVKWEGLVMGYSVIENGEVVAGCKGLMLNRRQIEDWAMVLEEVPATADDAHRAHCQEAMLEAMEAEEQAYSSLSEEERQAAAARQQETDDEMDEEERIEAKYAAYVENVAISAMDDEDRRYCEDRLYGGHVDF